MRGLGEAHGWSGQAVKVDVADLTAHGFACSEARKSRVL